MPLIVTGTIGIDTIETPFGKAEQVLGELLRYVREARAELHQALPPAPEPPISE